MFIEGTDNSGAASFPHHRLNLNRRFITFEERLTETQKAGTHHSSEKNESFIQEKWSCGKIRLLSKHLSQKVSGLWPFLGQFPEKKNNQENFYWVSILTSPYRGFRVFLPGVLLTFVFDRNPLMQI
jgi:hypothetical protein